MKNKLITSCVRNTTAFRQRWSSKSAETQEKINKSEGLFAQERTKIKHIEKHNVQIIQKHVNVIWQC